MRDPAVELLKAQQPVHIKCREAIEAHRTDVAARALHPQHLHVLAGERIAAGELSGSVAAPEIGHRQVRAEQVRSVQQQFGRGFGGRVGRRPAVGRQGKVQGGCGLF